MQFPKESIGIDQEPGSLQSSPGLFSDPCIELLPACRAELLHLPVQIFEGTGVEHDAARVQAVVKAVEVTDLVRPLLGDTIHKIPGIRVMVIVLIGEPGGGDDGNPGGWPGKPEEEQGSGPEEILTHHQENRTFNS